VNANLAFEAVVDDGRVFFDFKIGLVCILELPSALSAKRRRRGTEKCGSTE
jgi:hypothetical protein